MITFEVGKPYLPALGLGEGVRFNIGPDGAFLLYGFDRPTVKEVAAVGTGQSFEIRFVTIDGILWILSKCGSLEWTDSPYNPRLSRSIPGKQSIVDGAGLGLTLVMCDSRDAVVKYVRYIGLGTEFSRRLLEEAAILKEIPQSMAEADASIQRTMLMFPTSKLAGMAPSWARFKL
jgi:hypothetical protein